MLISLNGNLNQNETIYLDSGYHFGYGIFETILVINGKPVLLDDHLERLKRGLEVLNITQVIKKEYILEQIKKLGCNNGALKISVSEKNFIITSRENLYNQEDYDKGFSVKVSCMHQNSKSHSTYLKSLNRIDKKIEHQKALKEGFNEVIFLNELGYIAEGSFTNLFLIKENKLYTPILTCGLLDGVIRKWIMNHFEVIEGEYTLEDLKKCEAIFLTNSLMGIMKVNRFELQRFKTSQFVIDIQKKYLKFLEKYL